MLNWYNKSLNDFTGNFYLFAAVNQEDLPYFHAQLLLQKMAQDFPPELKDKAYVAGGAVRDELLGNIPKDIDIVVEYPQGGIVLAQYIAETLDLRPPVIFPTFGTAQLLLKEVVYKGNLYKVEGVQLEFVQTRKEQYHEESRKPETSFGTLKEDTERRDFTVNSLLKKLTSGPSLNAEDAHAKVKSGDILDLTGKGIRDMKDGIIRTPLDPDIIFKEDALRMMRAVRFSIKYGWKMTPEVVEGIKNNIYRLNTISNERIKDELDKIIGYKKLHLAIPVMKDLGLLGAVLPEMEALAGIEQGKKWHSEGDAYVHSLLVIENVEKQNSDASPELIWAALAHDWGKKAAKVSSEENGNLHFYGHEDVSAELVEQRMRELKYPVEIIKKVRRLVSVHMRPHGAEDWGNTAFRRYFKDMGEDYEDALKLLRADESAALNEDGSHTDHFNLIKKRVPEVMSKPIPNKPPLGGLEVIDLLRPYKPEWVKDSGPHIGMINKLQHELLIMNSDIVDDDPEVTKENLKNALLQSPEFERILKLLKWKE